MAEHTVILDDDSLALIPRKDFICAHAPRREQVLDKVRLEFWDEVLLVGVSP